MSQMMEDFYRRIEEELHRRETAGEILVLDAATGAGNCAVRVAKMLKHGHLITVDKEVAAWNKYARKKIEGADVLGHVEFYEVDIADMAGFSDSHFDVIISGATLSAMGMGMVDGLSEFGRVAMPGALLAIYDLMPQGEPETMAQKNAVIAWRLSKAIDVLRGMTPYEEVSPAFVSRRLKAHDFVIEHECVEQEWGAASEESVYEYLHSEDHLDIKDANTRLACVRLLENAKAAIKEHGMANFSRRYSIFTRKAGGR